MNYAVWWGNEAKGGSLFKNVIGELLLQVAVEERCILMRHCYSGVWSIVLQVGRLRVQMYRCPPHFPLLFVSVCRQQPLLLRIKLIIHLRGSFSSSRKQNKYLLSRRVTKEMSQQCKEVSCCKQGRSDTSSLLPAGVFKRSCAVGSEELFNVIWLHEWEEARSIRPEELLWSWKWARTQVNS